MRITLDIDPCSDGDGIDLTIGDMIYRNITGLTALRLGTEEICHAIDDIAETQSAGEPPEPDMELELDRQSGIPDHRWPA